MNEGLEVLEKTFAGTRIEKIMLPRTLKKTNYYTFSRCGNLKKVYVEDGCETYRFGVDMPSSTEIGPMPGTMMGNENVWDLRNCETLVIPEGIERIGNHWFWGSEIENVVVPASVKKIEMAAFRNCKDL